MRRRWGTRRQPLCKSSSGSRHDSLSLSPPSAATSRYRTKIAHRFHFHTRHRAVCSIHQRRIVSPQGRIVGSIPLLFHAATLVTRRQPLCKSSSGSRHDSLSLSPPSAATSRYRTKIARGFRFHTRHRAICSIRQRRIVSPSANCRFDPASRFACIIVGTGVPDGPFPRSRSVSQFHYGLLILPTGKCSRGQCLFHCFGYFDSRNSVCRHNECDCVRIQRILLTKHISEPKGRNIDTAILPRT